jgi:hypothetical protein
MAGGSPPAQVTTEEHNCVAQGGRESWKPRNRSRSDPITRMGGREPHGCRFSGYRHGTFAHALGRPRAVHEQLTCRSVLILPFQEAIHRRSIKEHPIRAGPRIDVISIRDTRNSPEDQGKLDDAVRLVWSPGPQSGNDLREKYASRIPPSRAEIGSNTSVPLGKVAQSTVRLLKTKRVWATVAFQCQSMWEESCTELKRATITRQNVRGKPSLADRLPTWITGCLPTDGTRLASAAKRPLRAIAQ